MRKIIKRYICVIAILSSIMGYTQCIKDSPNYMDCMLLQSKKAFQLAEEEAAKSKAREAIAEAEKLIAVGLVQIDAKAQIQTLEIKILQVNLEKSQAAKYEQDQARKALAQAQEKLDLAIQELNKALNIAAATAQIPNLAATRTAQTNAAEYTALAVQHAQLAAQQYAYATGQATSTNPSLPTWYMDYDGDGWHSSTQQKKIQPGAFGWKSTTKGIDCNDKDSTKTYDCSTATPVIPWFRDNDGDHYHGAVQPGTSKPTTPGTWTDAMTRGPDCNDDVFSADNSVCVVPCTNKTVCPKDYSLVNCECEPITPKPDPCAKIKKLIDDQKHKDALAELKKNFGLHYESGYYISKSKGYEAGVPKNNDELTGPTYFDTYGIMHVHPDDYKSPPAAGYTEPSLVKPIRMFSPADINTFCSLLMATSKNHSPLDESFVEMVSSTGTYQLRFDGDISNVKNFKFEDLGEDYRKHMDVYSEDLESGIITFIKNNIDIDGIMLYKINEDGTSERKTFSAEKGLETNPC